MELPRGSMGAQLGAPHSEHRSHGTWRITCFGDLAEGPRYVIQWGF
jgi:hypothetical protein